MANPALDRMFAPTTTSAVDAERPPAAPPMAAEEVMTFGGTFRATAVLLALVFGGAAYGWSLVSAEEVVQFPGWLIWLILGSLVLALVAIFKPETARWIAPIYSVGQGVVLGAISHLFNLAWDGIAAQALLATASIFVVMMILWATRAIRVTQRTRSLIIGATLGIAVFYLISIMLSLFGTTVPLVWDTGLLGIGFSAVVVIVAAFNLLLDFDLIERGTAAGFPAYMNWYAAFGLILTIIWLYIEMLRLLAKIRSD